MANTVRSLAHPSAHIGDGSSSDAPAVGLGPSQSWGIQVVTQDWLLILGDFRSVNSNSAGPSWACVHA